VADVRSHAVLAPVLRPIVRALRFHGSSQRLCVSTRGQQGADPGLSVGRHRGDLPQVARQAGPAQRAACRHVRAELGSPVTAREDANMQARTYHFVWVRRAFAAIALIALAGCSQQPSYQVINAPVARAGTVESVREVVEQKDPSGLGMVAGGLIGGGLGSLVGGGTGRTVATVVGALGGGYVGNQLEKGQTQV